MEEMNLEQVVSRLKEIEGLVSDADDKTLDSLTSEVDTLIERKKELEEGIARSAKRKALNEKFSAGTLEAKVPEAVEDAGMVERKAFMNYVVRGVTSNVLKRADAHSDSTDLGILIPEHVQQEILQNIKAIHGSLYNKVKKLNLKGAVKYPVGSFSATFKRITESTVSDRQDAGGITGSVVFGYNIGEIRIAQTYLQNLLSVPVFEAEFAKTIAEAYVKAMDTEIMTGTAANNQMEGITTKSGVKTIEFTATEFADWKQIQKKLYAAFPLGFKSEPYEFVMTNATYEANIKTLADDNNRPVYNETFSPIDGALTARFKGHEVTLVENDILADFDSATSGKIFGMVWVPQKAYAVNTNDQFSLIRYMDHETNQIVDKALVVNDGKVLRPDMIYLLKKKVAAAGGGVQAGG